MAVEEHNVSNVIPFTGQVDKDGVAANFFAKVLSPHGRYSAAIKKKRGAGNDVFENKFFDSIEALWECLRERDGDGHDVYFTLATFGDILQRTVANVFELKALSLDIDYGDAGHKAPGYKTYDEAKDALLAFCKTVGFPVPIVIKSGGGIQAHWAFEEPISRDKWLRYAIGLQAACHAHGLRADHGLTVNAAHIMRPPGTSNHKLKAARAVEAAFLDAGPYPLDKFAVLLAFAPSRAPQTTAAWPLLARPAYLGVYAPNTDAFPERFELVDLAPLLAGCGVVKDFNESGDCTEPVWMRMAVLAHYIKDGEQWFHEASARGYPDYDRVKAQTKYDRAAKTTGPPLCSGMKDGTDGRTRDICLACPNFGLITTPADLARITEEEVSEAPAEEPPEYKKAPFTQWDLTDKNLYRSTYKNACIALGHLETICRFDTFHNKRTVDEEQLSDDVIGLVRERIITRFRFDPGAEHLQRALERECKRNEFNPIANYLRGLRWDGVRRLDSWLVTYLGAEDTEINRSFGRKVLLAGVRRVLQPGCKFDTMLVLEGIQGAGKSSVWLYMAGGAENFSDTPIKWDDPKQQRETIGGVWIHEVGELVGLKKAEVEAVKNFLSRQNDRVRAAYDRYETDRPRQGLVVGTINGTAYLNDPTGARRFWPVKVGRIDLEAIKRDRDQLWAEAASVEATGEPLELPRGLWGAAAEQQDLRRVIDPWEDILTRVDGPRVSSYDLATKEIGIAKDRLSSFDAARIASIMKRLGWDGPKAMRIDGKLVKGYEK